MIYLKQAINLFVCVRISIQNYYDGNDQNFDKVESLFNNFTATYDSF